MKISFKSFEVVNGNSLALAMKSLNITTDENWYRRLKNVLKIKRAQNIPFVRIGAAHDGGYIMADDFLTGGILFRNIYGNFLGFGYGKARLRCFYV